jgi:hypothetical protein
MLALFILAYLAQIGAFQGFLFLNLIPSEFFLIQWYSNWWQ